MTLPPYIGGGGGGSKPSTPPVASGRSTAHASSSRPHRSRRDDFHDVLSAESSHVFEELMRKRLSDFQKSRDDRLELPPLGYDRRKLVHKLARDEDLRTFSKGRESSRSLTVIKPKGHEFSRVSLSDCHNLRLSDKQVEEMQAYVTKYPIEEAHVNEHFQFPFSRARNHHQNGSALLMHSEMIVPKSASNVPHGIMEFRRLLPAYQMKKQILEQVICKNVVLITGGTGCGKTTQVPQFILEDACERNQPVRIICTQPRRLPAIAVAERVAKERGEVVGSTVGYHIRLEQKTNPKETVLTYCTSGVLLRMLTVDRLATNISHIILDEIHEREQNTDYLLIALREALKVRNDLKVILMSATMEGNRQVFINYFQSSQMGDVDIPARLHHVDRFFLADVLAMSGYLTTKSMMSSMASGPSCFPAVDNWSGAPRPVPPPPVRPQMAYPVVHPQHPGSSGIMANGAAGYSPHQMHASASTPSFSVGEDYLDNLASWMSKGANYNRQHSATFLPTYNNYNGYVYEGPSMLNLAALPPVPTWPDMLDNVVCSAIMNHVEAVVGERSPSFSHGFSERVRAAPIPREHYVSMYESMYGVGDSVVDITLLYHVILFLMDSDLAGSILVFLPGYDDIVHLRDRLTDGKSLTRLTPRVYTLHSQMNSSDQQKVFEHIDETRERKVILSTNIAEASLTIDDVVFVVDSGKVKEKTYEHESRISQLKLVWIAKSNAEQRSGRAGRCRNGYCFRLYSEQEYDAMLETQVAEMKRTAIHEVCLHAKMFAPDDMTVKTFLGLAPDPPDPTAIDSSFDFLRQLGALFMFTEVSPFDHMATAPSTRAPRGHIEPDITELGGIIAHLPLDPQLARLLLFGIALQCFDPIVTLVAALSHREPFILPLGEERMNALSARDELGKRDLSDHIMLIRAFNAYVRSGRSKDFCRKYYLSPATMRMIEGIRRQLLFEVRRLHLLPAHVTRFDDPDINTYSNSWPMVQAAIVAGCYPCVGITRSGSKIKKIKTPAGNQSLLHPSSVVKRQLQANNGRRIESLVPYTPDCKPDPVVEYLVFQELARIDEGLTLRTVTASTPLHTMLFAGAIRMDKVIILDYELALEQYDDENSGNEITGFQREFSVEVDNFLAYSGVFDVVQLVMKLRFKFMNYFLRWLRSPGHQPCAEDQAMMACINNVLCLEHNRFAFNPVTDLPAPVHIPEKERALRQQQQSNYPAKQQTSFKSQSAYNGAARNERAPHTNGDAAPGVSGEARPSRSESSRTTSQNEEATRMLRGVLKDMQSGKENGQPIETAANNKPPPVEKERNAAPASPPTSQNQPGSKPWAGTSQDVRKCPPPGSYRARDSNSRFGGRFNNQSSVDRGDRGGGYHNNFYTRQQHDDRQPQVKKVANEGNDHALSGGLPEQSQTVEDQQQPQSTQFRRPYQQTPPRGGFHHGPRQFVNSSFKSGTRGGGRPGSFDNHHGGYNHHQQATGGRDDDENGKESNGYRASYGNSGPYNRPQHLGNQRPGGGYNRQPRENNYHSHPTDPGDGSRDRDNRFSSGHDYNHYNNQRSSFRGSNKPGGSQYRYPTRGPSSRRYDQTDANNRSDDTNVNQPATTSSE